MCEENNYGLKISVIKLLLNNCYCVCGRSVKPNCCCFSQIDKGGTRNCVNTKEIDLKLNTNLFLFYLQFARVKVAVATY